MSGNYTVIVDGKKFNVTVAEGNADIKVTPATEEKTETKQDAPAPAPTTTNATDVNATVNGNVWKILVKNGDKVEKGQVIMILEAMKMEIDIAAPQAGTIATIDVEVNDAVADGQLLATME